MPRRRNSKLSRAIQAAIYEEERARRREIIARRQQIVDRDIPIAAPAHVIDAIQEAEEIVQAIFDQRPIVIREPIPPADRAALIQRGAIVVAGVLQPSLNLLTTSHNALTTPIRQYIGSFDVLDRNPSRLFWRRLWRKLSSLLFVLPDISHSGA